MVIYVTRRCSEQGHADSRPCYDCFNTIHRLGIKKMVYTTREGEVESCKPCNYFGNIFITIGKKYENLE